jgi:hypothetical protein
MPACRTGSHVPAYRLPLLGDDVSTKAGVDIDNWRRDRRVHISRRRNSAVLIFRDAHASSFAPFSIIYHLWLSAVDHVYHSISRTYVDVGGSILQPLYVFTALRKKNDTTRVESTVVRPRSCKNTPWQCRLLFWWFFITPPFTCPHLRIE